jgi:DNA-binding transcriptional ArsR family regulator
MARFNMTPEVLGLVSDRFKALADPGRLQLLQMLKPGPMTVGDLVEATGLGQANVSKHLRVLHQHGFLRRRKDGLFVYYEIADRFVFQLCDLMCGHLQAETKARTRALAG